MQFSAVKCQDLKSFNSYHILSLQTPGVQPLLQTLVSSTKSLPRNPRNKRYTGRCAKLLSNESKAMRLEWCLGAAGGKAASGHKRNHQRSISIHSGSSVGVPRPTTVGNNCPLLQFCKVVFVKSTVRRCGTYRSFCVSSAMHLTVKLGNDHQKKIRTVRIARKPSVAHLMSFMRTRSNLDTTLAVSCPYIVKGPLHHAFLILPDMYGSPFRVVLQISMTYAWFLQALGFTRCPLCDSPWWGTGCDHKQTFQNSGNNDGTTTSGFHDAVTTRSTTDGLDLDTCGCNSVRCLFSHHQRKETSFERPSTAQRTSTIAMKVVKLLRLSWTTINVENFAFCRM